MKKILLFSLVIMFPLRLSAQLYQDAGGASVTIHSQSHLKELPEGSSLENRKFAFNEYALWVPLPSLALGKTDIYTTLRYKLLTIDYDMTNSLNPDRPEEIHEVQAAFFIKHAVRNDWSVLAMLMPGLASDFRQSLSGDDVLMQWALVATKKFRMPSRLEVGAGLFATYVFGDLQFIPAITLDYQSANGKWIGQAYWPMVNFLYCFNQNSQAGIALSMAGTTYNLKDYQNEAGEWINHSEFSILHTGLHYNQRLMGDFWMQLQGGMALNNTYILYNKDNRTLPEGNYSLENMIYGRVMITYRFENNQRTDD